MYPSSPTPTHPTPEHLTRLDDAAWSGAEAPSMFDSVLDAARALAPDLHAGISMATLDGTWTTLAASDPVVAILDELQYGLGEGPALTAIHEGHAVLIDDAESEHRWPAFVRRAVDVGLRSHLSVVIRLEGKPVGALNLYSLEHLRIDAEILRQATRLAAQSAGAVYQVRRESNLVHALEGSRAIGKAIGLMMERFDVDDHEAFERLTALSQHSNLRLRDIADHLVKQQNDLRHFAQLREAPREEHRPDLTLLKGMVGFEDETGDLAGASVADLDVVATPVETNEIPA